MDYGEFKVRLLTRIEKIVVDYCHKQRSIVYRQRLKESSETQMRRALAKVIAEEVDWCAETEKTVMQEKEL